MRSSPLCSSDSKCSHISTPGRPVKAQVTGPSPPCRVSDAVESVWGRPEYVYLQQYIPVTPLVGGPHLGEALPGFVCRAGKLHGGLRPPRGPKALYSRVLAEGRGGALCHQTGDTGQDKLTGQGTSASTYLILFHFDLCRNRNIGAAGRERAGG